MIGFRLFFAIFLMFLVTYLPRMVPFVFLRKKIHSRFLRSLLQYVPYGVLAAMTVPDIFTSTATLASGVLGFAAALFLSFKGKSLLTVALGAAGVVFVVERMLALLPW